MYVEHVFTFFVVRGTGLRPMKTLLCAYSAWSALSLCVFCSQTFAHGAQGEIVARMSLRAVLGICEAIHSIEREYFQQKRCLHQFCFWDGEI